jgi:hypothetical protein
LVGAVLALAFTEGVPAAEEAATLDVSEDIGLDPACLSIDCSCTEEGFVVVLSGDTFGSLAALLVQHLPKKQRERKDKTRHLARKIEMQVLPIDDHTYPIIISRRAYKIRM